jgi:hypothetical protein
MRHEIGKIPLRSILRERGMFCAYFESKKDTKTFVDLLGPIFSDLTVLAKYVEAADRDAIDD